MDIVSIEVPSLIYIPNINSLYLTLLNMKSPVLPSVDDIHRISRPRIFSERKNSSRTSFPIDFAVLAPSLRHLTVFKEIIHVRANATDHGDSLKFCIMALSGMSFSIDSVSFIVRLCRCHVLCFLIADSRFQERLRPSVR